MKWYYELEENKRYLSVECCEKLDAMCKLPSTYDSGKWASGSGPNVFEFEGKAYLIWYLGKNNKSATYVAPNKECYLLAVLNGGVFNLIQWRNAPRAWEAYFDNFQPIATKIPFTTYQYINLSRKDVTLTESEVIL